MKASTKRNIAFIFIVVMLGVLTACSGESGESKNEGDDSTISMIHYFNEEQNEPVPMAQLEKMDDFLEDNPDIDIDEEIIAHDDYETKIKTLAAGNELPDLFLIKGSMIESLADNEQITSLDDFFEDHEDLEDKFVDGMLAPYEYDDSLYGVTLSGGGMTHVIYYNTELFDEAGIDEFPETWDDFEQAIDKLNDSGVTPIAVGNKEKWLMDSSYLSTLANRFTGSDWLEDIANNEGDAKFTDPEFVEALETINNLAENNAFNKDMNSIAEDDMEAMYMNEEAAMMVEGDWGIGALNNNAPDEVLETTEMAFFPEIENSKHDQNTVSGGGGWSYAINADVSDEKKEKIKDLIYEMVGEDASKLTVENGAIPAIPVQDEDIETDRLTKDAMALMEDYEYVSIYDNILPPSLIDEIDSNLQNMLIGEVTPEQVAENIQAEYEQVGK